MLDPAVTPMAGPGLDAIALFGYGNQSTRQNGHATMKLVRESGEGSYRIRSFEPGRLTINETVYESGVVLSLTELQHPWPVTDVSSLQAADLDPVLALNPEIILLGTGDTQQFPPRSVMRNIVSQQIGLEVMDTASACRTFNVLMSEGRRIVAALVV